jgi:tetratricopeptide (TPR) repeat protein
MAGFFLRPRVQVLLLLVLAACARRVVDECSRAYRRHLPADALPACTSALARTGNVEQAGMLAYSLYAAGKRDEARALLAKYGTATGLLELTSAALDWRSGNRDGAAERLSQLDAASLALTVGDNRAALEAANLAAAEPAAKADPVLAGRALSRVFDVLLAVGDVEGAERVLRAISDLKADDPVSAPYLALKEGVLNKIRGRNALARSAYLRTIEGPQAAPLAVQWSAQLNLVELALEAGQPDQAATELARAETLLPSMKGQGNPEIAFHYHRAWLHRLQKDHRAAAEDIQQALSLSPTDEWAWMLELERAEIAFAAGDRVSALDATGASIAALERLRTEMMLEELKAWLLPTRRKPFELRFVLQAEQGDTMGALDTAELMLGRTLLDAFISARASPSPADGSGEALTRAEILRDFLPALRTGRVTRPSPAADVLPRIRAHHAVLYLVAMGSAWRFDIHDGRPELRRLPIELSALQAGVQMLRDHPGDAVTAAELGAALLPHTLAPAGEELVIVASGPFSGLPFALLRIDGHAVYERHAIEYVPSLSTFAALLDETPRGGGPAMVMGDAGGDLPGAREEALIAGRALGVEPLLGRRAVRAELRREPRPSVIHLALHGGVGPLGSWVKLADGDLLASDVFALRLRPRLVAISACASAATRIPELWGSMSAAFLASGSQAVLGALWSVEDSETRAFVDRFYAEGGARRPGTALARTQRWMAERGAPPSTWAAFVVLGL